MADISKMTLPNGKSYNFKDATARAGLVGKADSSHTHTKSQITDFPSSLPANGGNADTVDGLHANGFIKVNGYDGYDCNTLYDAGLYLCSGQATNTPNDLKYGSLFVMPYRKPYGNLGPDYCAQIFIPNGDVAAKSMWYRTSLQNTWNEWKRSCDDGNADTVKTKPYVTGTVTISGSNDTIKKFRIETNHGFKPSWALCCNIANNILCGCDLSGDDPNRFIYLNSTEAIKNGYIFEYVIFR